MVITAVMICFGLALLAQESLGIPVGIEFEEFGL
jgi:hypothetical protein